MDTPSQQRTRKGIYLRGRPSSKKNSAKTNSPADLGSPAGASVASDAERAKELASKTLVATAAVGAASPAPTPANQKAATGLDVECYMKTQMTKNRLYIYYYLTTV